jgi:catechol 2,3-dioxygenase-like lactoylglutathione lyase family enzyme
MTTPRLTYVIAFVDDMDRAIAFYRDVLGLALRFASPGWAELETGETTLALHPASAEKPAGTVQIGLGVPDLDAFHREATAKGVVFTAAPERVHGRSVARLRDSEGSEVSVGGP